MNFKQLLSKIEKDIVMFGYDIINELEIEIIRVGRKGELIEMDEDKEIKIEETDYTRGIRKAIEIINNKLENK